MRREHGADVRAYVDDFIGLNNDFNEAVRTFAGFESLCDQLGLKIAAEKSVYPTLESNGWESPSTQRKWRPVFQKISFER